MNQEEHMTCYRHPDRETLLRCNRCGRPICTECAVHTPTGFRCKDCIREQQKVFDTAKSSDYPIAAILAFVPAALGSYIEDMIGFIPGWLTGIILGMLIAGLISTLVRKVIKGRRSGKLDLVLMVSAGIGAVLPRLTLAVSLVEMGMVLMMLPMLIYPAVLVLSLRAERSGMIFRG